MDRDELKKEPWASFVARAKSLGSGIGPSGYEGFPQHKEPVHKPDLIAYHYTVNTKWQTFLLRQFGSDGLFTDAADRRLELLRGSSIALEQAFQKRGIDMAVESKTMPAGTKMWKHQGWSPRRTVTD